MASRRGRGPARGQERIVGTALPVASEPPRIDVGDEVFVQVATPLGVVERSATVTAVTRGENIIVQTDVMKTVLIVPRRLCRVYRRFGEPPKPEGT